MTTSFSTDRFIDAVERRGVELRRSGSEYIALGQPCPACGSEGHTGREPLDRVRLEPASAKWPKAHYWCHRCGAWNDGVDFLMRAFGMSFPDAYRAVTGEAPPDRPMQRKCRETQRPRRGVPQTATPNSLPAKEERALKIQRNPLPCPAWMARSTALACEMDDRLAGAGAEYLADARRYIEDGRGIDLEWGADMGIYWNPRDRYEDPARWGLKREKKLFIPRGICIFLHRRTVPPWEGDPWIVGLLVRRANPSSEADKLRWVPFRDDDAGQDEPKIRTMVLGLRGWPVVMLESALDAALAFQECWGTVAVVATCGASYPLDKDAAIMLKAAPKIWAWPDADKAGMDAFRRWKKAFPSLELIEMPKDAEGRPWAKDATGLISERRRRPECPTVRQILAGAGVVAHG